MARSIDACVCYNVGRMDLAESSITESNLTHQQLRQLLDISRMLAMTADLDLLLHRIAEAATCLLDAERASIYVHDAQKQELWTFVALGTDEIRLPHSSGICGHAFQTNQSINLANAYDDPRFNCTVDQATGYRTHTLLTVPMVDIDHQPLGVVQAINKRSGLFTDADKDLLELLAAQAGVALQRYHLQRADVQRTELIKEMDLARRVQLAMLPHQPPSMPGLDVAGWSQPASITGGDCFDLWKVTDDRLGLFVADASGHGLAPAIIVSQARTVVRALAEINADPAWLLQRVNSRLSGDLEDTRFVTAFVGCVNGTGELAWSSAGHSPVIIRTGPGEPLQLLDPPAPPVGVAQELPGLANQHTQLSPGGWLVVTSDGIPEAMNATHELWNVDRLMKLLSEADHLSAAEMLQQIRIAIHAWQGRDDPLDDQTIIVVKRN